jgi:hypothetical protein
MEESKKDSESPPVDEQLEDRDEDSVPDTPRNDDELVDKESADSFPASDPPSY